MQIDWASQCHDQVLVQYRFTDTNPSWQYSTGWYYLDFILMTLFLWLSSELITLVFILLHSGSMTILAVSKIFCCLKCISIFKYLFLKCLKGDSSIIQLLTHSVAHSTKSCGQFSKSWQNLGVLIHFWWYLLSKHIFK